MPSQVFSVPTKYGIVARTGSEIVRLFRDFPGAVSISRVDQNRVSDDIADGHSIMELLMLASPFGSLLKFEVEDREGATEILAKLREWFESKKGDFI